MWTLLLLTLPTQPNAVRLRVWRGLKTLGCAALRDGAYVLPEVQAARFEPLAAEVREHGGSATLVGLRARDEAQQAELMALFDRAEAYAAWRAGAETLQAELAAPAAPAAPAALTETDARRRLRGVAAELDTLRTNDFFPGAAAAQAEANLATLRAALDARFSRGEPAALAAHAITRLDVRRYRGKRWATRTRPWVDRLACAWLIRRFIDADARFLWLPDPAGTTPVPRGALGFDYDGATFTHVGARVTFEVMAAAFGLDGDVRLQRVARSVHYLDAGGIPTPEAAGLEAVLGGLREVHADDDALMAAAAQVFDALHAAPTEPSR